VVGSRDSDPGGRTEPVACPPSVNERIAWWRTDLGDDDAEAVARAIRERHVHFGPVCGEFECKLARATGAPYVVSTTSGSVALVLSLLSAGVGPGDEVLVPAATFIAPAHAALLIGATVRLVDVERGRPLLDPAALASAITKRTRAVIAVHLNGRAADIAAIRAAAGSVGAVVIEDCAQAFASRGPHGALGTLGDVAAFSTGITKLVTTGEGGFVATKDEARWRKLVNLRNHGAPQLALNRFTEPGCNFRMTDMQAALGISQLAKLARKIADLKRVHAFYREGLAGVRYLKLLEVRETDGELPLWTEVVTSERARVIARLAEHGIEAKPFHPSLAESPHLGITGDYPNAAWFAAHGLTLPSGPDQPEAALRKTVEVLNELAREIDAPPAAN